MAGYKHPKAEGRHPDIRDGTLCRAESPRPGPVGTDPFVTRRSKWRILAFDGAKVHGFLHHVALAEIESQDLEANPLSALYAQVPQDRANERASVLYRMFLDACQKGPKTATAFLAEQHNHEKQCLLRSKAILESVQRENAKNEALRERLLFAAQATKSAATAFLAIAGLFLAGPEIVTGAGLVLGYDLVLEFIKRTGPSLESHADAVVVGFKQTAANDAVGVAGAFRQRYLETMETAMGQTLRYPKKSSIFRSMVADAAHLDALLKTLGVISAGVTLYTEWKEFTASLEELRKANHTH